MYTPVFSINNQILQNISRIEGAKAIIDSAPLVPAYERQFQQEAIVRTVHFGTRIEGNDLTYQEVQKIVDGQKIVGQERDVQEVINYRNVIKYLEELWALHDADFSPSDLGFVPSNQKEGHPFIYTEDMLKKIHLITTNQILPSNQAGHYRQQQVVLKNSQTGEVIHRPPPAVEVPYLCLDFFKWLNSPAGQDIHPVIQSAIAQYALVAIHPFVEGNGRVSRAFALLVLLTRGYDIKRLFSIEEYFDKNAETYYEQLQFTHETNSQIGKRDLSTWIGHYSQALSIELERIKEKVQQLSSDIRLKQRLGGKQVPLAERQIKLVEYMQQFGGIRMPDAKELLPMVSDDTIWRDLKDLIERGVVKKHGSTKGAYYTLGV
jgi:Fic family protein